MVCPVAYDIYDKQRAASLSASHNPLFITIVHVKSDSTGICHGFFYLKRLDAGSRHVVSILGGPVKPR